MVEERGKVRYSAAIVVTYFVSNSILGAIEVIQSESVASNAV